MRPIARSAALSIALDLSEWEDEWNPDDAMLSARHLIPLDGPGSREALDLAYTIASLLELRRAYDWVIAVAAASDLEYVPVVPGLLLPEEGD